MDNLNLEDNCKNDSENSKPEQDAVSNKQEDKTDVKQSFGCNKG